MFCNKYNVTIPDEKITKVVKSSRFFKNKHHLTYLLNEMKQGDILMVANLSRFSRNLKKGLDMLEKFHDKGIIVYSVDENIYYNSINKHLFAEYLLDAEKESNKCSFRTKKSVQIRKSCGTYISNPKFGYMTYIDEIDNTRKIIKNHDEQNIIKTIIKFRKKYSYVEIANHLNENKLLNKNKLWTYNSVKHIYLSNRNKLKLCVPSMTHKFARHSAKHTF
jgi:DNA invertase Pin-like site-specific DNA recombinase